MEKPNMGIHKIGFGEAQYYQTVIDSTFILSSSLNMLKDALDPNTGVSSSFQRAFKAKDGEGLIYATIVPPFVRDEFQLIGHQIQQ